MYTSCVNKKGTFLLKYQIDFEETCQKDSNLLRQHVAKSFLGLKVYKYAA